MGGQLSGLTADELVHLLAASGGRRSAARHVIAEEIVAAPDHFTADELAQRVRRRVPTVNLSTVYRTLDALEELGVLDHVHLGHGRAVFHRADQDHQHLVCERCECVEELPAAKLQAFVAMLDQEFGFKVDRRHFAIVGLCKECRQ